MNSSFALSLFVVIAALLTSCQTNGPQTSEAEKTPHPSDPLFQYAEMFDRYVHGTLLPEKLSTIKEGCRRTPKENPFCPSFLKLSALDKRIVTKTKVFEAPEPKKTEPTIPKIEKEKILNWDVLTKAAVGSLLKGLLTLPRESRKEVTLIANRALAYKNCPNNIGTATAATLEDFYQEGKWGKTIAKLYEKSATCAKPKSVDREHFLTRSALFFYMEKDFTNASRILAKVSPTDAFSGRALYWNYRTRLALQDKSGARAIYKKLRARHPFSFHSLVSTIEMQEDPAETLLGSNPHIKKRSTRKPAATPFIEQAEILQKYGFDESASVISDWAMDLFPDLEAEVKIYLAELGDAHTKVKILPYMLFRRPELLSRHTLELAYPKNYYPLFAKNRWGIDPYLLLSIARKESAFNPRAVSHANAQGLLQLSQELTQRLMGGVSVNLLDVEWNGTLAAQYLTELSQHFSGELPLAIASYNAGEVVVDTWTHRYPMNDSILLIDLIPYRETRDYVGFVMANYYWYHRLYEQDAQEYFKQILKLPAPRKT